MPHAPDIFARALALPGSERTAFLDEACGGNGALRAEIESLLESHGRATEFLEHPTAGAFSAAGVSVSHDEIAGFVEGPGSTIGKYRLLGQLGEGGFGTVFLAEQREPVARKVALKIIKLGMDTRAVIARFEAERQALALMEHVNIAKVLDAGSTDSGRPYFVMELVHGEPITDYCDRNRLSIPARLQLIIQVCRAVQHAHAKGVVHRDIKPRNVLVSTQDDRPLVKVIDFGIAKATGVRLTDKTFVTEHRAMIGTLEYMSPEQAEGSDDIDTRTDVYSLGVLLYELLTGSTPFESTNLRSAAYHEAQRIIREVDPPRPSARLSSISTALHEKMAVDASPGSSDKLVPHASAEQLAHARRTDQRTWLRELRRDLDWIILKALEKDRARRYATPDALAQDIERYLAQEPVIAGPPSAVYRIGKFARRHRVGVAAGLAVSIAVVAGGAAATWGLVNAQRELFRAQTVKGILLQMLKDLDPMAPQRGFRGPGQGMDAVGELLEKEPRGLTKADRAEVFGAIGSLHYFYGEYDRASDRLRRKVELVKAEGNERAVTDTLLMLADAQLRAGKPDASLVTLDEAEPIVIHAFGDKSVQLANLLDTRARVALDLGDGEGAMAACDRAIEIIDAKGSGDLEERARLLASRCGVLQVLGLVDEAIDTGRRAMDMAARVAGDNDNLVAVAANNLGAAMQSAARFDEAASLYAKAIELYEKRLDRRHPDIWLIKANLANLSYHRGDFKSAEELGKQVAAISRDSGNTPQLFDGLIAAGSAILEQGRFDEAVTMLEEAMDVQRVMIRQDVLREASARLQLADAATRARRAGDWESLARRALELRLSALGDQHPLVHSARSILGAILARTGKIGEAEALVISGFEGLDSIPTFPKWRKLSALGRVVEFFEAKGDAGAAAAWRAKTVD